MNILPPSLLNYPENSKEIVNGYLIFTEVDAEHSSDWMHLICNKGEQELQFLKNLLRDTDYKSLVSFWENAFFGGTLFKSGIQLYGPELPLSRDLGLEGWAPLSIRIENEKRSQWIGESCFCIGSLLGDQENFILECYGKDVRIVHGSDIYKISRGDVCSFLFSLICKFEEMFKNTGEDYTDNHIKKLIGELQ